ncbi:MAG TPA: signal peptidase I [Mycobacteriales bacterium]|nr:signal peptidase I [Mycobacteriales bacterium]
MTAPESRMSEAQDGPPPDQQPVSPDQSDAPPPDEPPAKEKKRGSFLRELPFLILIALVLALLIKTFLVQAFFIPSGSMENTLHIGDRVLVNKLVYRIRDVHRGEIIVFRGPTSWQDNPEFTSSEPSNPISRFFHDIGSALGVAAPSSKDFIKRVIGVAGDHVVCCDAQGHVTVNGRPLTEPYLYPGAKPSDTPFDVTVPKGRLWVMGDHRNMSADSRAHISDGNNGTIPTGNVIGRAFIRVWPPSDWGTLGVPSTFHQKGLAAALVNPLSMGFAGAVPLTLLRRRFARRRRRGRASHPAKS